jgi:preprotein translocase subunit SecE
MEQAAKLNKDESDRAAGFTLPAPVERLASYPKRFRSFLHDVRVEMRQVNWPSRQDVISTTIVVALTVAFFGVYFFFTDSIFGKAISWVIAYAKKL